MEWRKIRQLIGLRTRVALVLAATALSATIALAASPSEVNSPTDKIRPIAIETQPIRWNPNNRNDLTAGELEWAGGIVLKSEDKEFGGWSGLAVSADGSRLLAISDEAHWLSAEILYDEKGRLSGLGDGTIAPMLNLKGQPILRKPYGDAEGLTTTGDNPAKGEAYVSFEHFHRIWRYDLGAKGFAAIPSQIVTERRLGQMPANSGMEALSLIGPETGGDNQRLLAFTEDARNAKGNRKAFIIEGRKVERLATSLDAPFKPTDLARLPNGDFLLLERSFSILAGPGMELRLIKAADVKPGATLNGRLLLRTNNSHTIDNMEGLAVRQDSKGQIFVYLISDDNYSILQHTYLMMFKLKLAPAEGSLGTLTLPHNPVTAE